MNGSPNILWICTDQQRWDTLSCLNHPGADTPHIDRLAKSGVAFTRAYCQSPICTPSRVSFLTGMYPIAHQVHRNGNETFPEHLPLVTRLMQQEGYKTGLVGKLHISRAQGIVEKRHDDGYDEFYWSHHPDPDWETGHDYHDWLHEKGVDPIALFADQKGAFRSGVPTQYHQTTWAKERARDFISCHQGSPWFLSINLFDPHPPFDPPQEYLQRFDPELMPMPVFHPKDLEQHAKISGHIDQQAQKVFDPNVRDSDVDQFKQAGSHSRPPDQIDAQQTRAAYHAMIAMIDDMLGELIDHLDDTGQRENTLVIFTSDHGEMLGDHGLLYKGCRFYEGLVHVPMVLSYPGKISGGRTLDSLVELIDLPQTILDFASIPHDSQMQGESLQPLLLGQSLDTRRNYVISEYFDSIEYPGSHGSRGSMYFDGRYKLCVYHDAETGELFDHATDPNEHNDLWADPDSTEVKQRLIHEHFNAMMRRSGAGPVRTADY